MKKSTEERLADIESGITRLTKMQGCVFNVLLILHNMASLIEKSELALNSGEVSLESINQIMNRSIVFMFGAMSLMGVSVSMTSLYLITQELAFRVVTIVVSVFAVVLGIYAVSQYRRASSQIRVARKTFAQRGEDLASTKEEAKALDAKLAQALAEWKELVPDDLVTESKSED